VAGLRPAAGRWWRSVGTAMRIS